MIESLGPGSSLAWDYLWILTLFLGLGMGLFERGSDGPCGRGPCAGSEPTCGTRAERGSETLDESNDTP
jgi:hypothetical protein